MRRFWWGTKENKKQLYLKAWESICKPKCSGGLGIRRFRDTNIAFITKLAWHLCTDSTRLWVQLVRSKYLRGRRVLDFQQTTKSASWLWSGVRLCYGSLRTGLCIKIGQNSSALVYIDPWIPRLPCFTIQGEIQPVDHITFVRDLLEPDRRTWNVGLVTATFPPAISQAILSIPVIEGEHDTFVWFPSASGNFSVRSAYRANNGARFGILSSVDNAKWKGVWHSNLHERHKLVLWKVLSNVLPTKDRIKQFVPLLDLECFLCGSRIEYIHHLLFECPTSVVC